MRLFARACEAVAATTSKNEKVRLVAEYLRSLPVDEAAAAALFFTGRVFSRSTEKVLAIGGSLLSQAIAEIARAPEHSLGEVYRRHGDLGGMTQELFENAEAPHTGSGLSLAELEAALEELSRRRGPSQKLPVLIQLLSRADALEAKYIVKIITGDLRIGLRENLVEEAIAKAFERPVKTVQRANMLTGNIGETLRLAAADQLENARIALFHPMDFMLAGAAETAAELIEPFPEGALVEDKYDGIRAQAHKSGSQVKFFSRTLDEVVEFPELKAPVAALTGEFILDGEIVGWRDGRALPFTELQQRLGRKQPTLWIHDQVPVCFMVFDLLYQDGDLLLNVPLTERRERLEALLAALPPASQLQISSGVILSSAEDVQRAFDAALARGNEGLMTKAPQSLYSPGRRGQFWRKLKSPLATLDVVVVAVEWGHGKRHKVLSDYTFAVRDGERLVTIGKAYSGLTDAEIQQMTAFFLAHTTSDEGYRRQVEPLAVIEVAFNNIQRSGRHESGFALRFPRIVRLRPDKPVSEIDTLDRVKEIFAGQHAHDAET